MDAACVHEPDRAGFSTTVTWHVRSAVQRAIGRSERPGRKPAPRIVHLDQTTGWDLIPAPESETPRKIHDSLLLVDAALRSLAPRFRRLFLRRFQNRETCDDLAADYGLSERQVRLMSAELMNKVRRQVCA